jgi:hypothetical protein
MAGKRNLHIHDRFVFIALGRPANVTEFDENIVFLVGLEGVRAPFLHCSGAEESVSTALARPVVNDEVTINIQLFNPNI